MEVNLNKPLEDKNIIEKHTVENQFKVGSALLDLERRNKDLKIRVEALEEAMQFFSEWYNKTQRANILVPDTLASDHDNPSIILLNHNSGKKSIMD